MALVPLSYNVRSLWVRKSATFLTVLGIGATVAVLAGVLALRSGFQGLFRDNGRDDIAVFLRQGSTNEGDSAFTRERAEILTKTLDVFEQDASGKPLVSTETYLAVRMFKTDGGETNVPVRGVQPTTFAIFGDDVRVLEGRTFTLGADEVIVGDKIASRLRDGGLGDTIQFNTTPFRVVGVFHHAGAFSSEIWGDRDRLMEALERPVLNRVIGRIKPGVDIGWDDEDDKPKSGLALQLDADPQVPCKVMTERQYLMSQSAALGAVLLVLGQVLAIIMGIAAVFTATNTMLSALAARTREIGILLSLGFKPWAIFLSFLFESMLLGLFGGVVGCVLAYPIHGTETGTMNFNTFTEVAFAFRLTPELLAQAVGFSIVLGLLGGAWPAFRAASMEPTRTMRRE
ncbi:MAG: ABC transporter permease [Planctomycetes bacterium]|nr:ABC transporter permease [Planctomycetota bacterium]